MSVNYLILFRNEIALNVSNILIKKKNIVKRVLVRGLEFLFSKYMRF